MAWLAGWSLGYPRAAGSAEEYRQEIVKLRDDFEKKKEESKKELERISVAIFGKGVGALVTGGAAAMKLMGSLGIWEGAIFTVLGAGLTATAVLTPELKNLIPARRSVSRHPLYFLDKI